MAFPSAELLHDSSFSPLTRTAITRALREAGVGTLMAFCGWDDSPYHLDLWPERWQAAYGELPAFDPAVSSSRRHPDALPPR